KPGFPVGLSVPAWYGGASVQGLRRVAGLDRPVRGYYQNVKYTVRRRTPKGVEAETVGPMAVKSEVVRPQAGATLGLGTNRVFGLAWAGEEAVAKVEVSADGGRTWAEADLIGRPAPY